VEAIRRDNSDDLLFNPTRPALATNEE
jgi:hypothetical protein